MESGIWVRSASSRIDPFAHADRDRYPLTALLPLSCPMKTILILAASPVDPAVDRLRLDKEVEEIRTTLQLSPQRDRFHIETRGAVRPQDWQQHLYDLKPQILHFSGHGSGDEGLVCEWENGAIKLVSTEALAALFQLFAQQVECVVLNACYAAVQAEAIAQHIPYVVGMNRAIGDLAARKFSQGFYRAIWDDRPIAQAFDSGVNAIALEGIPEQFTPVLVRQADVVRAIAAQAQAQKASTPSTVPLESPEGQMRIDSNFYIPSSYEERCYEEIQKPGSLIRIKSPSGMGKSSLMGRVLAQGEQWGYRPVVLNLDQANHKLFSDLEKFMQWFCASVGKTLGVRVKTEEYWDDIFGANDNVTDYFENYVLEPFDQPLVLAIDNFDRIFNYADIEIDFCGLLRGWYERSRTHKLWGKLRLLIVYSQEPYLQRDINQSPFNVGMPIELGEFTAAQVQQLVQWHGLDWSAAELSQLMGLVGGHPYLVRSALYHVAMGDLTLPELLRTAPTEAGIYSDHLLRHLRQLEEHPELRDAMRQVVQSPTPVRLERTITFKLDSMGLVQRVENQVQPRCDLYRQYFAAILAIGG